MSNQAVGTSFRKWSILAILSLQAGTLLAQHPQIAEGRTLFVKLCSACHGDTGKGGRGTDLTTGTTYFEL